MTNPQGDERRCGVEVEYIDVPLARAADIIAGLWHGDIEWQHDHHATITTEDLGKFTVELDVEWMQKLSLQAKKDRATGQMPFAETADKMLFPMVSSIAPNEIVSPPIPFSRLHELDELVSRLREAGAKGTSDSVMYAFGVHLNPETPSLDSLEILDYLRAFLLLYDWMKFDMQVDATRSLTGFARAFPVEYVRKILDAGYAPDMHTLIDDYLHYNPTRNRALDMLPLFCHIDKMRVLAKVEDSLVKSRPTFHFRLPNCHIDRIDWNLSSSWDYWLQVERLAANKEQLRKMQQAYLTHLKSPFALFSDAWREETPQWLKNDH
ncbi:MAG: amidoligase family protein [Alphaproteobacteria bacterium]|nr:amidoligase family protein [Alphaproteobacteria bacterium]